MEKAVCPSCGAELDEWGYHLCRNASLAEAKECPYCGRNIADPRHVCKAMLHHLKFTCLNCGRVAVDNQHLCNPSPIE